MRACDIIMHKRFSIQPAHSFDQGQLCSVGLVTEFSTNCEKFPQREQRFFPLFILFRHSFVTNVTDSADHYISPSATTVFYVGGRLNSGSPAALQCEFDEYLSIQNRCYPDVSLLSVHVDNSRRVRGAWRSPFR